MKRTFVKLWLILFVGLVAGSLTLADPAWSIDTFEWLYTHGHSGHFQTPSAVVGGAIGWGLDFELSASGTWVHFAVPSKPYTWASGASYKQWQVRYLRLKFRTYSSDVRLMGIHAYDGNIRFKVIDKPFASAWYGDNDLLVDLGANWNIYRSLGVSVYVGRGVENLSHRVIFYAVGARWQK